jgi:long-chain acyl-CoA synthetase
MHPRIHAMNNPDKAAIIDAMTGETLTFGELEQAANRGAQALRALGIGQGDTVALMCGNGIAFHIAYWAAQRAGITLVTVSTRLTANEVSYLLTDSEAVLLLVDATLPFANEGLGTLRAQCPGVHIVTIGPEPGFRNWNDLLARQSDEPIREESAGCRMVYSSGTTGRPKGIRKGQPGGPVVFSSGPYAMLTGDYGIVASDIYLNTAPLYHTAPMTWSAAVLEIGGTVVLMRKFEPADFLEAVGRWGITVAQMVPTMFIRLLKLPEHQRLASNLSTLRLVVHAAAPCPAQTKRAMIDWLGPILSEYYAGSEGNGSTLIHSDEWLRKPGSVGRAIMGTLHICDDSGNELPAGEIGTVYFESAARFAYHNDDEKTRKARHPLHPDWSTLGDVGHIDAEGYLFLSDRKDFMIISGGVNIYPQEIENLLIMHPAVADVAVFGVPHPEFGEEVKAVVQPVDWDAAGEALAAELITWCRTRLADLKCPRSVDFERQLPRADTGKLFKMELKARYWQAATSAAE